MEVKRWKRSYFVGCSYHCNDANPNRFGEDVPLIDHQGQVGILLSHRGATIRQAIARIAVTLCFTRGLRSVESGLENRRGPRVHRGFESHPHRLHRLVFGASRDDSRQVAEIPVITGDFRVLGSVSVCRSRSRQGRFGAECAKRLFGRLSRCLWVRCAGRTTSCNLAGRDWAGETDRGNSAGVASRGS